MEQDVKVAGGTADIETGQLLVIKRSLCLIAFCNFNISISSFPQYYRPLLIDNRESTKSLHADGCLFLYAGT